MVESYAGILEKMLANAKEELKKQGVMEPQNDEEAEDYYDKLIRYCEDMQKSDTRFKAFDNSINKLREYYLKVAIESAKKDAASPFYAYEDYYMQHYNFSTQSYYLRCCYMANVDLQLKRAYNILAIYHNIAAYPDENKDISQRFAGAVNTIESRDLGSSPLDVPSGNVKIYSSTFKKTFTGGHVGGYLDYDKDDIANCWDKYTSKLYGGSVKEDLLSAGFDLKNAEGFGLKKTKGPVCEVVKVSKFVIRPILASYYTDYILFDGGTKKNTRTYRDETVTSLFFLLDDSMKNLARG